MNPIYAKLIQYVQIDKKNGYLYKNKVNGKKIFHYYKSKYNSGICTVSECVHCRNIKRNLTSEEIIKIYNTNHSYYFHPSHFGYPYIKTDFMHDFKIEHNLSLQLEIYPIFKIGHSSSGQIFYTDINNYNNENLNNKQILYSKGFTPIRGTDLQFGPTLCMDAHLYYI